MRSAVLDEALLDASRADLAVRAEDVATRCCIGTCSTANVELWGRGASGSKSSVEQAAWSTSWLMTEVSEDCMPSSVPPFDIAVNLKS